MEHFPELNLAKFVTVLANRSTYAHLIALRAAHGNNFALIL
jgi:hypothetical protein